VTIAEKQDTQWIVATDFMVFLIDHKAVAELDTTTLHDEDILKATEAAMAKLLTGEPTTL